jgi:agmatinase
VHENGIKAVVERILEIVGNHKAYLTFDIDCLDPAFAPGTGTPVAGGLSSAQALGILRGLGPLNFIGADVVEVDQPTIMRI